MLYSQHSPGPLPELVDMFRPVKSSLLKILLSQDLSFSDPKRWGLRRTNYMSRWAERSFRGVNIHTHTYIHTYIHTLHIYIHFCLHTCTRICVYIYTYMNAKTHVYIYIYVHRHGVLWSLGWRLTAQFGELLLERVTLSLLGWGQRLQNPNNNNNRHNNKNNNS